MLIGYLKLIICINTAVFCNNQSGHFILLNWERGFRYLFGGTYDDSSKLWQNTHPPFSQTDVIKKVPWYFLKPGPDIQSGQYHQNIGLGVFLHFYNFLILKAILCGHEERLYPAISLLNFGPWLTILPISIEKYFLYHFLFN